MFPETSQRRIVYSGRVQGVGFRYTACRVAGQFSVSGFVRNLPDGTVELAVSGEPDETDRFLEALSDAMAGYVSAADETAPGAELPGEGFEVRY